MSYKYSVGDHVMYNGICVVEDIRTEKFGKTAETLFYVLCSVSEPFCRTYVPVASPLAERIRPLLSPDQISDRIIAAEASDRVWIDDAKERSSVFSHLAAVDDTETHLWIFKALSLYKRSVEAAGKKLYASDSRILDAVKGRIETEFSFVLGIDRDRVVEYILSKISRPSSIDGLAA